MGVSGEERCDVEVIPVQGSSEITPGSHGHAVIVATRMSSRQAGTSFLRMGRARHRETRERNRQSFPLRSSGTIKTAHVREGRTRDPASPSRRFLVRHRRHSGPALPTRDSGSGVSPGDAFTEGAGCGGGVQAAPRTWRPTRSRRVWVLSRQATPGCSMPDRAIRRPTVATGTAGAGTRRRVSDSPRPVSPRPSGVFRNRPRGWTRRRR